MKISGDDLALALQRMLDRAVRRFRRGSSPERTDRRFLIVQIDGLSRVALEHGLASDRMPFVKRMLQDGDQELVLDNQHCLRHATSALWDRS